MNLKNLSLVHFKNYESAEIQLSPQINCFVGDNGSGKTNLLDAVHYLSNCKSYFNPIDSQNINHEAPFFVIQGSFDREGKEEEVYCGLKKGQKKVFKRNQKEYDRLADHIGRFPSVVISPYDTDLIHSGSEFRRKFMDSIISQFDRVYLDDLIQYNKALNQRNRLLRAFSLNRYFDDEALLIWDHQLVKYGTPIAQKRKEFVKEFLPRFNELYKAVSGNREEVELTHTTEVEEGNFALLLLGSRDKDRSLMRTTKGIHKDDLVFTIGGHPLKKFGSQGQQKSFLIALKLAQFDYIRELTGAKPLLLLDDIFDKIDDHRVAYLMKLVSEHRFGQIFVTDTHRNRVPILFSEADVPVKVFEVKEGSIELIEEREEHEA